MVHLRRGKAASVVGHSQRQFSIGALQRHEHLRRLGVPHHVLHRLRCDTIDALLLLG